MKTIDRRDMRWIITGMNGTVAPALAAALRERGDEVVAWNRAEVPVDDEQASRRFVDDVQPDGICHLAMGAPEWAAHMAAMCREKGLRFLFTSTVSVFGPDQQHPLTPQVEPAAADDYGAYKRECERQVLAANPDALVARLGWQIGTWTGSNTMLNHLAERAAQGPIEASRAWRPSSSFLPDTAAALVNLLDRDGAGVHHLEGNPGWSFLEIAQGLNRVLGLGWEIVETDEPVFDNRRVDDRVRVAPLSERLA